MFLHDYLLACETSIVRTLDSNSTRHKTSNFQRYLGKCIHISQTSVCMKSSFHQLTTCTGSKNYLDRDQDSNLDCDLDRETVDVPIYMGHPLL